MLNTAFAVWAADNVWTSARPGGWLDSGNGNRSAKLEQGLRNSRWWDKSRVVNIAFGDGLQQLRNRKKGFKREPSNERQNVMLHATALDGISRP